MKIVSTANVICGAPRIEGTRISVYDIVSSLWNDRNIEEYIEDFSINKHTIEEALLYCKDLLCQKNNVANFCDGCILRALNSTDIKDTYSKINANLFIDSKGEFYIAEELKDIENEEFGYAGWYRADELYKYFFFNT